jgi:pSer/pThr/pTyr-binding forkhead associated (FHA) protein
MSEADLFGSWADTGDEIEPKPRPVEMLRPKHRPPVAILIAFDDGRYSGEVIRVRNSTFTIGRAGADFNLPHDRLISPVHVKIIRTETSGRYVWNIEDCESDTGLFVRTRKLKLIDNQEILVGSSRYEFVVAPQGNDDCRDSFGQRLADGSIASFSLNSSQINYPNIRCVAPKESGNVLWLISGEYWIGRDPECSIRVQDDPHIAKKHVQISQASDCWVAKTFRVRNGMWARMRKLEVARSCTFLIGEQRFRLLTKY